MSSKDNAQFIKSIQVLDDEIFEFPPNFQPIEKHKELVSLSSIKSALKSLRTRNQYRNIKVTLPKEIAKLYFDVEGNACFCEEYLPEMLDTVKQSSSNSTPPVALENVKKNSMRSITKDMIFEKFNGKNANSQTWLKLFILECDRLGIEVHQRVEVLRLFLEGTAAEWFVATWTLMAYATWSEWSEVFLDNFGEKGWSEVISAFNFKYIGGSYSEYAIKKLNLLLQVDPELNEKSRVMFIIIGLPYNIREKLNRRIVDTQRKLMVELSRFEAPPKSSSVSRFQSYKTSSSSPGSTPIQSSKYKPCAHCAKISKRYMFHPEKRCWYNEKSEGNRRPSENRNNNGIKITNNTEIENRLNEESEVPKN